ncbi:GHMP kinase [candidate division KSB1 bacterium]|nr:GHMP kinase [candidate division KSB1 bacterium]MBL7092559.1 GHMP kinase [candidate division KSB1 bacterium]
MIIESSAYARAGLLGNPSDGYFGKTISIIVRNFGAHVTLYQTPELNIEPIEEDLHEYKSVYHLAESVNLLGYYGGQRLIKAAIKKFLDYCEENEIKLVNKNFTIRYHSSIPRQVGLAGSSAIITATMKALMKFYNVKIPVEILPNVVLAAEIDELGISAGLQDRVIQAYEGCVFMDFDKQYIEENKTGKYERIDPKLLPNLYIAYKIELGKVSGKVLNDIRTRFEKGDSFVVDKLRQIADCAEQGKKAILKKDYKKLNKIMNNNFDLRAEIMNINKSNMELIETARKCGAPAKFTGSGGSIIGTYKDDEMLTNLIVELKKIKARVIKPYIM